MSGKRFAGVCLVFGAMVSAPWTMAQWNAPNPVVSYEKQTGGLEVKQKDGVLRLEVNAADVLHVTYSPADAAARQLASDGVVVKKDWPAASFEVSADDKAITLTTAKLKAVIERESGALHYVGADGKQLTTESYRSLKPVEVNGEKTFHAESFFAIYGSQEGLYGLGQHQAGVWNYRGETVDLSQENTNIAVPLLVSTNGYGIFWNNPSRGRVNNRFVHMLYLSAEVADRVDYYFIYGPDPDQIIGHYRELTGEVPLFGRWAYGFWQCKNKYQSQQEIEGVAAKYRALHIPVDNIVQDWFWWVTMGEMKWNEKYPDPQGLINKLHDEHFHLMVSVWPYFRPGSAVYDEFDKKGWFVAKTKSGGFHPLGQALYDATNPDAQKQYWANVNTALFQKGVDAWWLDTDEPETEGREDNILTDRNLHAGSGARYANVYPLFHAGGVSEGQQASSDKKRVFILSRSAYAGVQRWRAALLRDSMVGRCAEQLDDVCAADSCGVELLDLGNALLDDGYRRIYLRWQLERSEVPRAVCAVVPVWCVLANLQGARHALSR